jgi:antitoxin MazE
VASESQRIVYGWSRGYPVGTPVHRGLMRARIVRVGNSRGVRLPKPLLDEAGLPEEVDIRAEPGRIVIEAAARPRTGWAEAAQRLAADTSGEPLDTPTPTRFDDEEWEW